MKRRGLICAIAAGVLSAGCIGLGQSDNREGEEVDVRVRNETEKSVVLDVFFTTADRGTLFSTRYDLEAETVDENHSFHGTPDLVYVVVDEQTTTVSDFEVGRCDQRQSTVITIVYEAESGVNVGFSCHG